MKIVHWCFFTVFIFSCFPKESISTLTNFRLSAESGLYQTQNNEQDYSIHTVSRFSAGLKLQESTATSLWLVSLQINPEFYQGDVSYRSLKFFSRGQYSQRKNKWQWGAGFDARKYSYFSSIRNSTFDLFKLDGFLSSLLTNKLNFMVNPSYYYRDLATQKLDAFAGHIIFIASPRQNMNVRFGTYLEHFQLRADFLPEVTQRSQNNNGWRYGPQFSITYLKKIYFHLHYLYLWHSSKITRTPSFEQYIQLLISRQLPHQWIIFFSVDYFWNNIHLLENYHERLAYIPYENENHIDVKVEKLIRKNLFLSVRTGYFKDNFLLSEFSIEGWQVLIGIDYEP